VAWLALALLTASHAPAAGTPSAPPRILLLDTPPALERALRTALSPWGMQVAVHPSASDAEGLAARPERAGALARAFSAAALVWLEAASGERRLWLFDASKGTSTSRDVPRGALDQALAAALALSIKTQLRGASADAAAPAEPVVTANPTPPAPPPARDVVRAEPLTRHAPSWLLLVLVAVRRGALEPAATETRLGAELRWSPALGRASDVIAPWLGARLDAGPETDVSGQSFRGQYGELGGSLALGVTRRLSQLFSTGLQLSVSLYSASLEGTRLPDTALAPETRWGSALQLRPEMGLSFGAIGFVVQPVLGTTLRRQSFIVGEAEVLDTRPVWWMFGVGASVSVE
jgi:hypothetical protein